MHVRIKWIDLRLFKPRNLNQFALLSIILYHATKDVLYLGMNMDRKTMHIIFKKDQTLIYPLLDKLSERVQGTCLIRNIWWWHIIVDKADRTEFITITSKRAILLSHGV